MRADRLLAIMQLLQTQGKMTGQKLADTLEVSRRTILRDIDALCAAGIPIWADGGHGGGFTLDEHYQTTLAGMQDKEIRTLFVGDNTQLLNEIGLGGAAESTMLKLRAVLPAAHQPSVEHMRQRILIDPAWWWRDTQPQPFWEHLQKAVYEDLCIHAVYEHHNGEVIERILEPYSLVAKSSVWYLVAHYGMHLRTYRVQRFRQITLLDRHFHRRADFDLPSYWQAQLRQFEDVIAGYGFTLRVHPEGMNLLKEIVAGRYQQIASPDSNGWLTLRFHLDSINLARMLVFGLGERAIVVEPQELHEAVQKTARALLTSQSQYGSAPDGTSEAGDI